MFVHLNETDEIFKHVTTQHAAKKLLLLSLLLLAHGHVVVTFCAG